MSHTLLRSLIREISLNELKVDREYVRSLRRLFHRPSTVVVRDGEGTVRDDASSRRKIGLDFAKRWTSAAENQFDVDFDDDERIAIENHGISSYSYYIRQRRNHEVALQSVNAALTRAHLKHKLAGKLDDEKLKQIKVNVT